MGPRWSRLPTPIPNPWRQRPLGWQQQSYQVEGAVSRGPRRSLPAQCVASSCPRRLGQSPVALKVRKSNAETLEAKLQKFDLFPKTLLQAGRPGSPQPPPGKPLSPDGADSGPGTSSPEVRPGSGSENGDGESFSGSPLARASKEAGAVKVRTEAGTERRVTVPEPPAGGPIPASRDSPNTPPKGWQRETLLQRMAHFVLSFA
ncbi:hypothetical protein CB1_000472005 [Camelus ferus]|nr:hypothetical protein CB1_000472005 [Camelus ferus]